MAEVTKPTVLYFNLPGKAEPIRWLLEDAGVDYEYKGFAREEWPTIKASNPQLTFGQVPFYAEPGLALTQSSAISRYLAQKHGYLGSTPQEAAKIDEMTEGVRDLVDGILKFFFHPDEEEKAKGIAAWTKETLPKYVQIFKKVFDANGGKYLVGNKPSLADIGLNTFLVTFLPRIPLPVPEELKAYHEAFIARPGIAKYLASKPYGQ